MSGNPILCLQLSGDAPEGFKRFSEDDMASVPALMDLREELHRKLYRTHRKKADLPFRFSEVTDLCMYYLNHIASATKCLVNKIA